jgi:hypothetical protein
MELSTIVRVLEYPTAGIDPSELPSGTLLYIENVGTDGLGSLYYAGGDDGYRRATYLKQVTSVPGGGTQVYTDASTIFGDGTILSPLNAKVYTTSALTGDGTSSNPLDISPTGIGAVLSNFIRPGQNVNVNFNPVGNYVSISSIPPSVLDGGSA